MATVKFNLEADEAKAVSAFLKVLDAQNKAEQGFKRTLTAGQQVDTMLANFGKSAAGFASIATAVDLATKALQFHNQELEKAGQRQRGAEFGLAALSQLAGGDVGKMRQMVEEAKKTSVESGLDLNASANLQSQLENFGIGDQRKLFADLVGTVRDPGALAEAAVTLRDAFGADETGDMRAIINKALGASAESKTDVNQLLTGSAQIAPGIAAIGGSDEEAMAALATLSRGRASPEMAATEIQALAKVIMRQGLGGQGLLAGMDAVGQQIAGMGDADKLKFFGDVEGFKAFSTLSQNRDAVNRALGMTDAGNAIGPADAVAGAINVRKAIPEIAAAERLRMADQGLEQTRADKFGVFENQRETMLRSVEQASLQRDESALTRFLRTSAAGGAKLFGADDEGIAQAAAFAGNPFGDQAGATEFIAAINELSGNIKAMNDNVQTGRMARNGRLD